MDRSHLIALEIGRSHEAERLANARTANERALRTVWLRQYDDQIVRERAFLGLPPADAFTDADADLLAELGI